MEGNFRNDMMMQKVKETKEQFDGFKKFISQELTKMITIFDQTIQIVRGSYELELDRLKKGLADNQEIKKVQNLINESIVFTKIEKYEQKPVKKHLSKAS